MSDHLSLTHLQWEQMMRGEHEAAAKTAVRALDALLREDLDQKERDMKTFYVATLEGGSETDMTLVESEHGQLGAALRRLQQMDRSATLDHMTWRYHARPYPARYVVTAGLYGLTFAVYEKSEYESAAATAMAA
jgi:hypothetical protein